MPSCLNQMELLRLKEMAPFLKGMGDALTGAETT